MSRAGCSIALGLVAAFSFSGCMISPNQDDHLGYWNQSVKFQGATLAANETVYVQARNPRTGHWSTIGQTTTANVPVAYAGGQWYYFDGYFKVPAQYWFSKHGKLAAEVRTTSASTQSFGMDGMLGFEQGFKDWFWINQSQNDALDRAVGQSVYIYYQN